MTEPIRLDFEVHCPPEEAFRVWTDDISIWWPADHTVSTEPDLTVVLEGFVGGRIFERTPDGVEHDWGEVWEPLRLLGYLWHLKGTGPMPRMSRFAFYRPAGSEAQTWRDRNLGGWSTLLPHYLETAGGVAATPDPE